MGISSSSLTSGFYILSVVINEVNSSALAQHFNDEIVDSSASVIIELNLNLEMVKFIISSLH